jgi:CRISPR-associated endonuclease/helicase Cas3
MAYWAKTYPDKTWRHLWMHGLDAAAAGQAWISGSSAITQSLTCTATTNAQIEILAFTLFFLFLHDIGKADTRFQFKSPELARLLRPHAKTPRLDVSHYDHGGGGLYWFKNDLSIEYDTDYRIKWMLAACSHHGNRVDPSQARPGNTIHPNDKEEDREYRNHLIEIATALFLEPSGLTLTDCRHAPPHTFSGFCSVCDWIGSNEVLFPALPENSTPVEYYAQRKQDAHQALISVGLIVEKRRKTGMSGIFPELTPRGIQTLVPRNASHAEGLHIIEAPTGSGKTEAALAFASYLLAEDKADSIIFALPTQATSNALLERLEKVAPLLFHDGVNVVLAHGKSRFSHRLKALIKAGAEFDSSDARIQCSQWIAQSRKRVFLGQIGICTIDQVLMSTLPVRHHFVRRFGIGRSILIIDEIHSYDSYMHGLLKYVLESQKDVCGNIILLSATLDSRRRKELIETWGGVGNDISETYPLVTRVHHGVVTSIDLEPEHFPEIRIVEVDTRTTSEAFPDKSILEDVIRRAYEGQYVAIVVNVVDHAQRVAKALKRTTLDISVDVFHSRFAFHNRDSIEQFVLKTYGKNRLSSTGRILVATQVVEQSLNLDFDYLVTQICPVDLLFQRIGRLHRYKHLHENDLAPNCLVLCPSEADYGVHACIYASPSLLWRTQRLLDVSKRIVFPNAYRQWIEAVYSDTQMGGEPDEIFANHGAWRDEQAGKRFAAQCLAVASTEFPDTDQNAAQLTRSGEMSLSILPHSCGRLLNEAATSLAELKRLGLHTQEVAHLCAIPAPASWGKWLHSVPLEKGFHLLPVVTQQDGQWTSELENGVILHYDPIFGLWREES